MLRPLILGVICVAAVATAFIVAAYQSGWKDGADSQELVSRSLYVFRDAQGAGVSWQWIITTLDPDIEIAQVRAAHPEAKDFMLIGRWKMIGKPFDF